MEPQQKYRIGTVNNIKNTGGEGLKSILHTPNLTLIFCSGSQQVYIN